MTPVSPRYAVPALVMLSLSMVLVLSHALHPRYVDDCANPEALLATSMIERFRTPRAEWREHWARHRPERVQWSEATVPFGENGKDPLHLLIIRSFRAASLAQRPIGLLPAPFEPERRNNSVVGRGSRGLPIHRVYDDTRALTRLAAYVFVYDGRPVSNPFLAQLRSAATQIVRGTRPLTLLLAEGSSPSGQLEALEERLDEWLIAAWDYYRSVCTP